jgi:hypothetical protein
VLAGVAISILTLMVLGVGSLRAIDLRIGSFAQRAFKRIQWL